MDVREAMVLSQGEQYPRRAAPLTLAAEAAVANASTGRTLPLLWKSANGQKLTGPEFQRDKGHSQSFTGFKEVGGVTSFGPRR